MNGDPAREMDPSLAVLDLPERGFVLGCMLLGLGQDGLSALAPPASQRCAAAIGTLAQQPREQKAARIAQLARELGAAFPPAVEVVHPSWLVRCLEGEPTDLLPALLVGAPPAVRSAVGEALSGRRSQEDPTPAASLSPELAAELRRVVFAGIDRDISAGVGGPIGYLLVRSSVEVMVEVRRLGARSLGASLGGAPSEVLARAMAVVGGSLASDLRQAAETVDDATRRTGEADVKAASSDPAATADERLERIGFQALQRLVRGESIEARRALALRLPRKLGKQLLLDPVPPGRQR